MSGFRELNRLPERKAVLLRQSAAHRRALAREARVLRPAAAWVDLGLEVARELRAKWGLLVALHDLWRPPGEPKGGLLQKATDVISLLRSLAVLWRGR